MPVETTSPELLNHLKWRRIADKIEADPPLLSIPLENIERWSATRRDGLSALQTWKQRIEAARTSAAGLANLLALLRNDSEASRHLKSYSPFPGVLTSAEVDEFTCAWRH